MVYGLAGAPVAAEHLLGVHSAVWLLPAAGASPAAARADRFRGRGAGHGGHPAVHAGGPGRVRGAHPAGGGHAHHRLLQPLLQKIPAWAGLVVSLLLFAATYHTQDGFWQLGPWQILLPGAWYANLFTAFFGFFPLGFFSTDYFPLLPWLFLFWAGYFLHFCMGRARMEPLRRSVCAPLGWLGRHSLGIYLLHQPVIYGVLLLLFHVFEQ